jgi:hypothetical protein
MPLLDQDQFRAWNQALLDAFTTKAALEPLAKAARNMTVDQLALGEALDEIVMRLIRRADEEAWLHRLIAEAQSLRPHDPAIAKLAEDLPQVAEFLARDHFKVQFLRPPCQMALVNRHKLRTAVRDLHENPAGATVLVVGGEKASGKTYSRHYIGYLQRVKAAFHFVSVDLTRLKNPATGAVSAAAVGRAIASQLRLEGMPAPGQEQDAAWAPHFCDWLTGALDPAGQRCWIVIDGFGDVVVEPGVQYLVEELASRIDLNLHTLRLVLLDYEDLSAHLLRATYEWIDPIGETELADFFTELHRMRDPDATESVLTSRVMTSVTRVLAAVPLDTPRRLGELSRAVAAESQAIVAPASVNVPPPPPAGGK